MASVARNQTGSGLDTADTLAESYRSVRQLTEQLTAPLTAEDMVIQSMPDTSPPKWHLAHTAWFFETFILQPRLPGYRLFHPRYGFLFNSYYNQVGPFHARPRRACWPAPSPRTYWPTGRTWTVTCSSCCTPPTTTRCQPWRRWSNLACITSSSTRNCC